MFREQSFGELVLSYLEKKDYDVVNELMENKESYKGWNLSQIIQYCQSLKIFIE